MSFSIAAGTLLAGVANGIAFPILPVVGVRAGLPIAFIGLILAANRAMRIVASPIVGALYDRYGGRRTLVAGLLVQIVVMALYTLGVTGAHPGAYFLAGRALQGPGSSCVFVAAQALALHAGGPRGGGSAAGTVRAAMAIGVPLGLVAGGVLADEWSAQGAFEVALVGTVLAAFAGYKLVPDLRDSRAAPRQVSVRALLRAMTNRRLLGLGALNFASAFSAQGMVLTTLSLAVRERHLSLLGRGEQGSSGLLMGLICVAMTIAMPICGRLGDRWTAHPAIAFGGLVGLVPSMILVALAPTTATLLVGLVLTGVAAGALAPSLFALVDESSADLGRGTAVGVLQFCGDVGGTIGPLLGTALFAGSLRTPYLVGAFVVALFVVPARWLVQRPPSAHTS
jgi:MFS family permease